MQTEITFPIEMPAHNQHGNNASYQENKPHYKNQTEKVLAHLLKGESVTSKLMYELHQIQDIRPRIAAIKKSLDKNKFTLEEGRIFGGKGAKSWKLINILAE